MQKNALLIIDHGSKVKAANDMLVEVANLIRLRSPELIVHSAHMELTDPTIADGIAACVQDGAERIVVHPYMLSPGRHATVDIPRMVAEVATKYPNIDIEVSQPLGVHEKIVEVVLDRAKLG